MMAEFALIPSDGSHLSAEVAKAVEQLEDMHLCFSLGPMGTTVEGSPKDVFDAMLKIYETAAQTHDRVFMTMTVDGRKTQPHTLAEMVPAVTQKLERPLSTKHIEVTGKYHRVAQG